MQLECVVKTALHFQKWAAFLYLAPSAATLNRLITVQTTPDYKPQSHLPNSRKKQSFYNHNALFLYKAYCDITVTLYKNREQLHGITDCLHKYMHAPVA